MDALNQDNNMEKISSSFLSKFIATYRDGWVQLAMPPVHYRDGWVQLAMPPVH